MSEQVKIKKETDSFDNAVRCSDNAHYPYGTSLRFDKELVEDLSAGNLAVGDVVKVTGYAFVDSKSEHTNISDSDKTLSIQMTSMQIQRETDDKATLLYGADS